MPKVRIVVTLDQRLVAQLDRLVRQGRFPSRSRLVEEAVQVKVKRWQRARLARECAKLDPAAEQALSEEGLAADVEQWPRWDA